MASVAVTVEVTVKKRKASLIATFMVVFLHGWRKETDSEKEESLDIERGMHVVYIFLVRLYLVDAC